MKSAALPTNESERQKALAEYQLLDTLPEEVYDDITRIASEITGTPIALLNLVDEKRLWTKSKHGLDHTESPRDSSFCAHAILDPDEIMVVEDMRNDERFDDNPLVTENPRIIFYAGVPIVNAAGHALGTLCIMDNRPRTLPESKLMTLKSLAKLVNAHFELRKTKLELDRIHQVLRKAIHTVDVIAPATPDQAQSLVGSLEMSLQSLLASSPRPDQTSHLSSLQEAVHALRTALDKAALR
jgi:GAF domain-containing protein